MRLLEFVPCGLRGASLDDDDPPCTVSERRRQKKPEAAWRPSLGAILEDGTAAKMPAAASKRTETSARQMKTTRRTKPAAGSRDRTRSEREEPRHFAVPAFAPAAFLF